MTDLYHKSIEIVLANQHNSGAYVASPTFSNYQFCWLRDGSYIAYSMDLAGETPSALAFFRWVDRAIKRYEYKVDELEQQLSENEPFESLSVLHTRFTLEGEEEGSDSGWGHFQIDGYGSWLWALNQHINITGEIDLINEFSESINTTVRFLNLAWKLPNYDCWEEHPEYLHPYSLAAVYGGLAAVTEMVESGIFTTCKYPVAKYADEVKRYILEYGIAEGRFVKHIAPAAEGKDPIPVFNAGVDSSLMGMIMPYQVARLSDPAVRNTMTAIENDLLRPGGGVYRYKTDTYYGGGEWVLLTAWLGWIFANNNSIGKAETLKRWIESCTDKTGNLPEQVSTHVLAPKKYQPWVNKWGQVASPLLWSHAMYIILCSQLVEKNRETLWKKLCK